MALGLSEPSTGDLAFPENRGFLPLSSHSCCPEPRGLPGKALISPRHSSKNSRDTCFSGQCQDGMTSLGRAGSSDPAGPAPLGSFGKNFPKPQCFVPTPAVAVTSALCQAVFAAKLWTLHWETQATRRVPGGGGQDVGSLSSAAGERTRKGWLGMCVHVCTSVHARVCVFLCVHTCECLCV